MLKPFLTIFLAIILVTDVGTVGADIVILKSGEMFETRKAWKENGVVNYYKNGRVVRVDEKKVERLIQSPASVEANPPPEQRPAADPPPSSGVPAADQSHLPPSPADSDTGFLDLRWGQPLSQFEGLTLVGSDPAYGGVQQYINKQRKKRFGRASVDNIFYGFWQGRLYTILVETSNYLDFMDLKAEALRRYGEGRQEGDHEETVRWTGKGSDRLLSYDYDTDTGYLWMRSQSLHKKVRGSYPE
ncbi:hypothetical protein [uncultured Desulfosarcina sp.]|uniref:hypothetical protein n=1 Tax=uncultured Desulfosarcina sp. TaxID=218289 RepID=UPI0029C74E83|nr:hypothetical protein [uncultured Desulfosarcina sp.]